ncbi:MAG: DUF362 domain-containing protein [Candidatus Zixiibacteriota bacterium]|nr:MAG: DUF362 domain-containing protein [candidate division Zixibacteria bacterium]
MSVLVNSILIDSYDFEKLSAAVLSLMEPLGGFGRFVKPGMTVLINPNLLSARTPDRAVTTHPELVRVVARECLNLGAKVLIGDSPGGVEKGLKRVWDNTGMTGIAELTGAELVGFEQGDVKRVSVGDRAYYISRYAFDVDFIISLPKLKTHVLTNFTGAIKNSYGFIPGIRKSDYHKKHPNARSFSGVIVDIFSIVKPGLYIMDGGLAMEGDGPASGSPRWLGCLFASEDAVAMDSSVMTLICKKERRVWPTEIAAGRGLGIAEASRIRRAGPAFKPGSVAGLKMPGNFYLNLVPSVLVKTIEPLVWVRPAMNDDDCTMCEICKDNCPQDAIYVRDGKMRIDYEKCIKCMCCHELCPEYAVFLNRSRLAKIIR